MRIKRFDVKDMIIVTLACMLAAGAAAWPKAMRLLGQQARGASEIAGRELIFDPGCRYTWNTGLYTLSSCAANGSTNTTVAPGRYLMTVTTETTNVCDASSCGTNGTPLVAGSQLSVSFNVATAVSCRSTGATGVVTFTPCYAQ